MKHVYNFIVGTLGTYVCIPTIILNTSEAITESIIKSSVSVFGGIVSTLCMFFLNRWLQKQRKCEDITRINIEKSVDKTKLDK